MSEDEKKPVTIHLHYDDGVMKIATDSLQPLSLVKDKIQVFWGIRRQQQHLYSDGKELTGDDKTLWNVALENVEKLGKPSVLKTLDKLNNWKIILEADAIEEEAQRCAVTIYLHYEGHTMKISTDSLQPFSFVRDRIKTAWLVEREQQRLYCDGKELTGDDKILWNVVLENVKQLGKPSLPKVLHKLSKWVITLETDATEEEMSKAKKCPVTLHLNYEGEVMKISTDSLQPLSTVKDQIEATLGIVKEEQRLYDEGKPLTGDDNILWNLALENLGNQGKPIVLKILNKLSSWKVTLEREEDLSKAETCPVAIHLNYGGHTLNINTNSLEPLSYVKDMVKSSWGIEQKYQRLYSDGNEITGDKDILWNVALENVKKQGKPTIAKILDQLSSWTITLEPDATEEELCKAQNRTVAIHLKFEGHPLHITTNSLKPLSYVKDKVKDSWGIERKHQRLYSDDKELTGDDNILWNVALENVRHLGKPIVLKVLDNLKDWKIKLEPDATEEELIKAQKRPVMININYEVLSMTVTTDSLKPLSLIKDEVKAAWRIEQQRFYSGKDGQELTGDDQILWNVALENVKNQGKPILLKLLNKIANWNITFKTDATEEELRKPKKRPVTVRLQYEKNITNIQTDDSQLLLSVKEKAKDSCGIAIEEQHLYSNDKEISGNNRTLWDVILENVAGNVPKALQKIKLWRIIVAKGFKVAEPIDIPNYERILWDMDELIGALNEKREVIFALSSKERISEDNEDTSEMVGCAKNSKWIQVFDILGRKPYIVNAIPQERAWSVLHQAVYKNNVEVVRSLLAHKTCDSEIKAKRDKRSHGEAGMTPIDLAKKYRRSCVDMLSRHTNEYKKNLGVTFIPAGDGETFLNSGLTYFDLACSFLNRDILDSLNIDDCSFLRVTEKMYHLLEKEWKYVQATVRECLYPFDKMSADHLGEAKSSNELKKAMISIYTGCQVYSQVNVALRRASETKFPVGDDLLLSLYSLFLTSILLHWKELERIKETSYRGLALPADQVELYRQGTTFHWLSFTSSSMNQEIANFFKKHGSGEEKAVFVIDNSQQSMWSPRNIKACSQFGSENEVLYPPCAKFLVTDVEATSGYIKYSIKLLHPDN